MNGAVRGCGTQICTSHELRGRDAAVGWLSGSDAVGGQPDAGLGYRLSASSPSKHLVDISISGWDSLPTHQWVDCRLAPLDFAGAAACLMNLRRYPSSADCNLAP